MNCNFEISCPAKTFILGEYGALTGGSAILINTGPRFSCRILKTTKASSFLFPEKSSIHQWIQKHPDIFKNLSLEWSDPYGGVGGLGFSSAQFNILYAYTCLLKSQSLEKVKLETLWRDYRNTEFEGQKPSGTDILSQWAGGVCLIKQDPIMVQSITSPFEGFNCVMIHTGLRMKTHEHLKDLKFSDNSDLKVLADQGVSALENKKDEDFIRIVNEYGKALDSMGFVLPEVRKTVEELRQIPEVLAVKGCGAMSAEVIIVFFKTEDSESLKKKVAHMNVITEGLQVTYGIEAHKCNISKEVFA